MDKIQEIEEFSVFDDWLISSTTSSAERFGATIPAEHRTEQYLIRGVSHRARWTPAAEQARSPTCRRQRDAIITKGIIALLIQRAGRSHAAGDSRHGAYF